MGRYLDLLRARAEDEIPELRERDKSDQSDQNHAKVESSADTRVLGRVWSHMSLMSRSARIDLRPAMPEPAPSARPIQTGDKWADGEEERASIVEFDGGIPRPWAEGFARLDPTRPPADVPPRRWRQFIDDVGRFLDGPHLATAIALGWGPYDLFGADRDRPYARIDQCGLLWLVNGDRLAELRRDEAVIENGRGVCHTWRRKPVTAGRVLPWEPSP